MNDKPDPEESFAYMLNALAGMEDMLWDNDAPKEAVEHVMEAYRLCKVAYFARFPERRATQPRDQEWDLRWKKFRESQ